MPGWRCSRCSGRRSWVYPQHVQCAICGNVESRDLSLLHDENEDDLVFTHREERPEPIRTTPFRAWGSDLVVHAYRLPGRGPLLSADALRSLGLVYDVALGMWWHPEGYVATDEAEHLPGVGTVYDATPAGLLPHDPVRARRRATAVLAAAERMLVLLEANGGAAPEELVYLRAVLERAQGRALP